MSGIVVKFHENQQIDDELLMFAVIMANYENKWIFCRHQDRDTLEIPGGHREAGESIDQTAERELVEETGAAHFIILPVCVYSVTQGENTTYGKLFFAEISQLNPLSYKHEIAEIFLMDYIPEKLTYPLIQPFLYEKTRMWLGLKSEGSIE